MQRVGWDLIWYKKHLQRELRMEPVPSAGRTYSLIPTKKKVQTQPNTTICIHTNTQLACTKIEDGSWQGKKNASIGFHWPVAVVNSMPQTTFILSDLHVFFLCLHLLRVHWGYIHCTPSWWFIRCNGTGLRGHESQKNQDSPNLDWR